MFLLIIAVALYDPIHLISEILIKPSPAASCRSVIIFPTRKAKNLEKFRGVVDYVVVDNKHDKATRVELRL